MKAVTDETWDELVTDGTVVKFYADWCGPCRMLAPTIERIADETPEVNFVEAKIEDNIKAVEKYNVMTIPKIIHFKGGKAMEIGGRTLRQIKAELA